MHGKWVLALGLKAFTNTQTYGYSSSARKQTTWKNRGISSRVFSLSDLNVDLNAVRNTSNCPIPEDCFSENSTVLRAVRAVPFFIWPTMSIKLPVLLVFLDLVSAHVLKYFIFQITKLLSSWHESCSCVGTSVPSQVLNFECLVAEKEAGQDFAEPRSLFIV